MNEIVTFYSQIGWFNSSMMENIVIHHGVITWVEPILVNQNTLEKLSLNSKIGL
jgi:hypothetical protein